MGARPCELPASVLHAAQRRRAAPVAQRSRVAHRLCRRWEACKYGQDKMVDLLLEHGGTLARTGVEEAALLCTCVFDGELGLLRRLLHAGANVDASDYDKRTALHIAAGACTVGFGAGACCGGAGCDGAGCTLCMLRPVTHTQRCTPPLEPLQWRATWPPASCW